MNSAAGEECDDGDDNSDTDPDACRTNCSSAFCGDGVVDSGEECDEGDDNSDTTPGGCSTSCTENPLDPDGGVDPDGSVDPDGGVIDPDGSSDPPASVKVTGGGCSCKALPMEGSSGSLPTFIFLFGLLVLGLTVRRR